MKRYLVLTIFAAVVFAPTFGSVAAAQIIPTGPLRVDQSVMSAQVVKKVAPEYPAMAKQERIQGAVVLTVRIDQSGDVRRVELISGHPMLAPAAIEAVKQWKYKPYRLNGEPFEVETKVTVTFTLLGDAAAEGTVGSVPGGIPTDDRGGIVSGVVGPAPANGSVPQRIRVSQGVAQSLIASKVQPQYPGDAKAQHIQGTVELKAIIDKEGNVANLQLISGHPMLAPAAFDAVRQWKYRPYLVNGTPIEVETTVTVNFTLVD